MEPKKRQARPLLTAAVGIATVSYVGALEGCADVDPLDDGNGEATLAEDDSADIGESSNALVVGTTATAVLLKPLPTSGNLMGPDSPQLPGGGGTVIRIPFPVGNLMIIPIDQLSPADLAAINSAGVR